MSTQENQEQGLSTKALENLREIDLDLDTTSEYFKPKTGTTYELEIDIERNRIVPIESEKFKDAKGNPVKQYQFIVKHIGNGVEQKWNVTSKTLLNQLMDEIRKNRKVFRITRNGEDRGTTYQIEAAQE
jgi:hypothetical protein